MTQSVPGANKKIRLILTKILEEYDLGTGTGDLRLETRHFLTETGLDDDQLRRILDNLQQNFIIESFIMHNNTDDSVCFIKPLNHFKARAEDYIETLSVNETPSKAATGPILYLDKNGDLWHGDREQYCYPMGATRDRFALVKYLAENKGLQSTDSISFILGGKDKQNTRTEIAKIRKHINHKLKIDDLIESKKDSGYKINPKYQIIIQ